MQWQMNVIEGMCRRMLSQNEMTQSRMYEIVPGFAANCLTILLLNHFIGQKDGSVLKEFDEVAAEVKR